MSPEEFRALLARSGGLIGTEIVDKAEPETVNGVATGRFKPRSGPIRLRYTTPNGEITAVQRDDGRFDIVDDPKGLVKGTAAAGAKAPDLQTFPDGSLRSWDPETKQWKIEATKPQGPQQNGAPTLHTFPDGSQRQWNPATSQWDPVAKPKREAPDLNLGAPRPGQRTNLALIQTQFNLLAQQWAADPGVDDAEYNRRIQNYIATYVTPAVNQATKEVNDAAEQAQKDKAAADLRSQSTTERQTRVAEQNAALAQAKFGYDAGQDSVSNAMKLLDYQHNPLFLEQFSAGVNSLARGGGGGVNFTPDAFRIPLPDVNALAEAGAQRAAAMYQQANGTPFTPRPVAGAVAGPTPLGGPAGPLPAASSAGTMLAAGPVDPLANVPLTPRPWDPASAVGPGSSPNY